MNNIKIFNNSSEVVNIMLYKVNMLQSIQPNSFLYLTTTTDEQLDYYTTICEQLDLTNEIQPGPGPTPPEPTPPYVYSQDYMSLGFDRQYSEIQYNNNFPFTLTNYAEPKIDNNYKKFIELNGLENETYNKWQALTTDNNIIFDNLTEGLSWIIETEFYIKRISEGYIFGLGNTFWLEYKNNQFLWHNPKDEGTPKNITNKLSVEQLSQPGIMTMSYHKTNKKLKLWYNGVQLTETLMKAEEGDTFSAPLDILYNGQENTYNNKTNLVIIGLRYATERSSSLAEQTQRYEELTQNRRYQRYFDIIKDNMTYGQLQVYIPVSALDNENGRFYGTIYNYTTNYNITAVFDIWDNLSITTNAKQSPGYDWYEVAPIIRNNLDNYFLSVVNNAIIQEDLTYTVTREMDIEGETVYIVITAPDVVIRSGKGRVDVTIMNTTDTNIISDFDNIGAIYNHVDVLRNIWYENGVTTEFIDNLLIQVYNSIDIIEYHNSLEFVDNETVVGYLICDASQTTINEGSGRVYYYISNITDDKYIEFTLWNNTVPIEPYGAATLYEVLYSITPEILTTDLENAISNAIIQPFMRYATDLQIEPPDGGQITVQVFGSQEVMYAGHGSLDYGIHNNTDKTIQVDYNNIGTLQPYGDAAGTTEPYDSLTSQDADDLCQTIADSITY